MKRIVLLVAMLAMMVVLAAPALAQGPPEDPGVETGPEHANSVCSYSGLNDFEEGPGPLTQSYGQEVISGHIDPSVVKSGAPSPGTFCNAHLFPYPPGPPPPE